jgi:hypothetical protein
LQYYSVELEDIYQGNGMITSKMWTSTTDSSPPSEELMVVTNNKDGHDGHDDIGGVDNHGGILPLQASWYIL